MRNALSIGEGHWRVFVDRPMSLGLLILVILVLLLPRLLALEGGHGTGTPRLG